MIAGLLLLSVVPVIGGVLRLGDSDASSGARPPSSIGAMVAHIAAMTAFCLLGAFQFSPALRSRRGWHRAAGRFLIPAGLVAALSAIWLAVFFAGPRDVFALAMVRLALAGAMMLFLLLGAMAIARRDLVAHGAWMTRAYAIAVANGTQTLVVILWTIPLGDVDAAGETWLDIAGSVITVVVAEMLLRRRRSARHRRGQGRDALIP